MPTFNWTTENEDGEEIIHSFPGKWVICDRCRGNGTHDPEAFSNGFTSSEWAEWDQESKEFYMQGGYDVGCDECGATGKVLVIDEEAIENNKKLSEAYKAYRRYQRSMDMHRRECEAERRYGA